MQVEAGKLKKILSYYRKEGRGITLYKRGRKLWVAGGREAIAIAGNGEAEGEWREWEASIERQNIPYSKDIEGLKSKVIEVFPYNGKVVFKGSLQQIEVERERIDIASMGWVERKVRDEGEVVLQIDGEALRQALERVIDVVAKEDEIRYEFQQVWIFPVDSNVIEVVASDTYRLAVFSLYGQVIEKEAISLPVRIAKLLLSMIEKGDKVIIKIKDKEGETWGSGKWRVISVIRGVREKACFVYEGCHRDFPDYKAVIGRFVYEGSIKLWTKDFLKALEKAERWHREKHNRDVFEVLLKLEKGMLKVQAVNHYSYRFKDYLSKETVGEISLIQQNIDDKIISFQIKYLKDGVKYNGEKTILRFAKLIDHDCVSIEDCSDLRFDYWAMSLKREF